MCKQYIGIKYKHRSTNPSEGLDCLTFIVHFFKDIYKIDIIAEVPDYNVDWHKDEKFAQMYTKGALEYCKNIRSYSEEIPFKKHDLLFFSVYNDDRITHAGIYVGKGLFIHCLEKRGVCLSKISTFKSRLKLIGEII